MRRTEGRIYRWLVHIEPMFAEWRNDPDFQSIFKDLKRHKAEQLKLLREHHKIPPPWSPDYEAVE